MKTNCCLGLQHAFLWPGIPHPDDEVFGCGGALALLRAQKIQVSLIIVTDGAVGGDNALGNLTQIRSQESREAAVRLGVSEPVFWGG